MRQPRAVCPRPINMVMTTEPTWLAYARRQIGVAEIVGPKNNPTIMAWAKKLGAKILGINVTDDESPWCGLFVAQCMNEVGIKPASVAVRASSWDKWGVRVVPTLGCVLRFQRPGGGHVGFYVGENKTHYLVLGGNQGNKVSIASIEKARCVEARWPTGLPGTTKPVFTTITGAASQNEA